MKSNIYNYIKKSRFSPIAGLLYRSIVKIVVILGLWRYPSNRDPEQWFSNDFKNIIFNRMYLSYKLAKPIKKAEKGSRLKEYFAEKRRQINQPLLPKGFQGKTSVTISAVGDLMNTKGLENSKDKFYSKIAELIFNADISIANLESSLTNSKVENTGLQINATPEQFDILKGYKDKRYTIFCTANNHILDRGIEGFETTHNRLEEEGFFYVGTNRSPEDQKKGLIITVNGIKFGFVAATYSVNKNPFPDGKEYLVNLIPFHRCQEKVDVSLLEEQISYCLNKNCDFIIVSLHWGIEHEFFPRKNQVNIAHHLIEYGADAIISHHTHNIQPYEIYQTHRDPNRKALIFYGLGNLSSKHFLPHVSLSLIANFNVVKGFVNENPKTLVANINGTPVLEMDYVCNKINYIQIERLRDLIKSTHSRKRKKYIHKAGRWADFILGKSWRN